LDLKRLTYFTWVYEEGSFTAAARKANVVQPTLSMQVKRLEDDLGVKLFERTLGGVLPTPAGRRLYRHSLAITREVALAQEALAELGPSAEITGAIRVGIPMALSRGVLAPTLLEFFERYPHIDISLKEAYTGTVVEWVQSGQVDFALGALPSVGPGLMQKLIFTDTVVLISSRPINGPNHAPCDLAALTGLKLILPSAGHSFAGFVRACINEGSIKPERLVEIDGNVGSMELMRCSDWAVLSPFVAVSNGRYNDLFVYPVSNPKIPFNIYLIYDQRRPLTPAALRFLEIIKRQLRIASVQSGTLVRE
jgi:LysR family nitrogen assimilation transcriptional regulator